MSAPTETWLLPDRQVDHPRWDRLPASVVHARRERIFLGLATLALASIAALVGGSTAADRTIDLTSTLGPWLDLPSLEVPVAALALPVALVAVNVACELYGWRRALALGRAGVMAAGIVVGIAAIGDAIDDRAGAAATALAYGACALVALVVDVRVFSWMRARAEGRRRWLRALFAPLLGQALGWAAFLGAATALGSLDDVRAPAIALGAAAYGAVLAIVAAPIATAIVRGALAGYLRVGRDPFEDGVVESSDDFEPHVVDTQPRRRLPAALVIETPLPQRISATRNRQRPFTTAEQQFFAEGDALSDQN